MRMASNGSFTGPSFLEEQAKWKTQGKKRKVQPRNIVLRLMHREIFYGNQNVSSFTVNRKFHQNLVPNFSVENIEKPNCFLRKFTYDGKYLMAFSADQTSVEFYEYQGPAAAAHLMSNISSTQSDHLNQTLPESVNIRKQIFNCFFKLKCSIPVANNNEQFNRECSLFTEDNRFAIVVSASFANEETALFYDLFQNNESLPLNPRSNLEDYTIHIIDIERGIVTARKAFKTDKIYLNYNHGIYLYKNTLAVLSSQHQTIYLFHITHKGELKEMRKIGRFCFEDDEFVLGKAEPPADPARPISRAYTVHPFREAPFTSLKHRLLVALFKYAKHKSWRSGNHTSLCEFFHNFGTFSNLKIWKMQLLDENHLLIKYEQEETVSSRDVFQRNWNLFVVYNYRTAEIVNMYPQFSEELLYIYENFSDYFRHPNFYICSVSNNYYARHLHLHLLRMCTDAKGGSYIDAVKMLLTMLPLNAQSYTPSPYLDMSLFSYDDKAVCLYEKPRHFIEMPIRFYDRETSKLLYRMNLNQEVGGRGGRRLAAFIYHPSDPLVISVLRNNAQYTVNIHFRHNNPESLHNGNVIRPQEYFDSLLKITQSNGDASDTAKPQGFAICGKVLKTC